MGKIRHLILKEIRHILRDPRSLFIAIMMPILMTMLYGYAINLDIKNIGLAVLDYDRTVESRELIGRFYNSGYFIESQAEPDMADPELVLKSESASAVLIIRSGLAKAMATQAEYQLGMLIDGSDANTSAAVSGYGNIILMQFLKEQMPPGTEIPGINISQQIMYNPDLKSSHFFVPGLIGVILMMISALLTSMTIAREKETGTMEQLLTSPVKPQQIIIGKVIPYIGLAVLDGLLVLLFAVFYFGVPFAGSTFLMFAFGILYVVAALALGILISTLVKTQQVAMMLALVITVLPSVMLSGFIFEIKNMPEMLQWLAHIVPTTYFILIIRGIMLKGSGLDVLWPQAAALIVLTIALLGIASTKFKRRIG